MIAADLLAVAAEQERRVVRRAVRFDGVVAEDQIHAVLRRRLAEPVEHPRTASGSTSSRALGFAASHLSRPSVSSGQRQGVAAGRAGLVDELLQFLQRPIDLGQDLGGFSRKSIVRFLGWAAAMRIGARPSGDGRGRPSAGPA